MKKIATSIPLIAFIFILSVSVIHLFSGEPQTQKPNIHLSLEEIPGYREHPTVLVFISLSCHICWEELFEMKDFIERMSLPVNLVGVSAESRERLENFVRRYSFNYPIIEDRNKALYRRFRVRLEPYVVVLDSKGDVFHQDDLLLNFEVRRELNKKRIIELLEKQ